jgi:dTDP-4-amino-4,6-dideoxygalactose transaminase
VLIKHGAWLAGRSGVVGSAWAMKRRARAYDAERDFALGDPETPAIASTAGLASKLASPRVAELRRQNYQRLLERLTSWVPQPFGRDPGRASPFAFPVSVVDKARVLASLARAGIAGVDAWSVPHPSLPVDRFPNAARRRARVVLLPVHQELRPRDVEHIASVTLEILASEPAT